MMTRFLYADMILHITRSAGVVKLYSGFKTEFTRIVIEYKWQNLTDQVSRL